MNRNKDKSRTKVGTNGDLPALLEQLASPAGMTRLRAREALVAAGDAAIDSLIEALNDDRDVVRWEAAKALASVPSPRAAPALVAALGDEESDVRWLAAEALIALGLPGLATLFEALEQRADSVCLREGAHHILRNVGYGPICDVAAPVVAALEHYDPELVVPLAARDALVKLKEEEGQPDKRMENER